MKRNVLRRIGRVMALAVILGNGVLSVPSHPARAQTTEPSPVTCWAESCSGGVCVRIRIQCPKQIVAV